MQALISHSFEYGRNFVSQQTSYAFFVRGSGCAFFYYGEIFMSFEFGEHLKDLRFEKGYSQAEIAKMMCIDRTTYTKYETGKSQPDIEKLKKLCEIFEVDYNTLLDY